MCICEQNQHLSSHFFLQFVSKCYASLVERPRAQISALKDHDVQLSGILQVEEGPSQQNMSDLMLTNIENNNIIHLCAGFALKCYTRCNHIPETLSY